MRLVIELDRNADHWWNIKVQPSEVQESQNHHTVPATRDKGIPKCNFRIRRLSTSSSKMKNAEKLIKK